MQEQQFLWYLFKIAVPTVIAIITLAKFVTEPIQKLKIELVEIKLNLKTAINDIQKHAEKLDSHAKILEELSGQMIKNQENIGHLDKRVNALEKKTCANCSSQYDVKKK